MKREAAKGYTPCLIWRPQEGPQLRQHHRGGAAERGRADGLGVVGAGRRRQVAPLAGGGGPHRPTCGHFLISSPAHTIQHTLYYLAQSVAGREDGGTRRWNSGPTHQSAWRVIGCALRYTVCGVHAADLNRRSLFQRLSRHGSAGLGGGGDGQHLHLDIDNLDLLVRAEHGMHELGPMPFQKNAVPTSFTCLSMSQVIARSVMAM